MFTIVVGAALLLTLVREAWIGLVIGCAIYLVVSPLRMRAVPIFAASAVLFVFLIASLPAVLGSGPSSDVISARVSTLGDTDNDESAITRRHEIDDALAIGLAHPLGSGLGTTG
ncbi:MAG: O-antigen ligase family protein, partial [Candidatus Eremiobacteraeota bacterium]|nr:O-antigen ligase family protein [Candidatus Eremiobacteraeota bacterium]